MPTYKSSEIKGSTVPQKRGIALYQAGSCPSGRSTPPNLSLINSLAWGTSVYRVSVRVKRCPRTTTKEPRPPEKKLETARNPAYSSQLQIRLISNCKYSTLSILSPAGVKQRPQDGRRVSTALQARILEMGKRQRKLVNDVGRIENNHNHDTTSS